MSIETGGPAFPHMGRCVAPDVYEMFAEGGMTLRDWFAGQALVGLLAGAATTTHPSNMNTSYIATCCMNQADAMLKARGES